MKGSKKFYADLDVACGKQYAVNGLTVTALSKGDDEGSIICTIGDEVGELVASFNILVPEPSAYPQHHQVFCFVLGSNSPNHIQSAAADLSENGAITIEQIIGQLLESISRYASGGPDTTSEEEIIDVGDSDEWSYDGHEDLDPPSATALSTTVVKHLQSDFNEIIAAGYKPGFTKLSGDGFCLSVSIPVTMLLQSISSQALMAWDPRILSKSQHFTLLISEMISWPVLRDDHSLRPHISRHRGESLRFHVGLTPSYKPSKDLVSMLVRPHGLSQVEERGISNSRSSASRYTERTETSDDDIRAQNETIEEFNFSLSYSLESLMGDYFFDVIRLRSQYGLGWAGAESLLAESQRVQQRPEDVFTSMYTVLVESDEEERKLAKTYNLPADPLCEARSGHTPNLPLLAFSYLLRRLTLCTRFCLICHKKLDTDFVALKPYVCNAGLCVYQYYNMDRGPSLEYEIRTRPETIELLISMTLYAAEANCMEGAMPTGLGLVVPHPKTPNTLREFDTLTTDEQCASVIRALKTLPAMKHIKAYLDKNAKVGRTTVRLKDVHKGVHPAAWQILRWCVASCTAYLEELTSPEDKIHNIDPKWRQFRFIVGAPDAEAKFHKAKAEAAARDSNAARFPTLYAFHGSPLKNWHSIIRHGLRFSDIVTHGRKYGHGIYFAKDYTVATRFTQKQHIEVPWPAQRLSVRGITAVAEIVNLPKEFQSSIPHFVVQQTDWIMCRYLLVDDQSDVGTGTSSSTGTAGMAALVENVPMVELDPQHPLVVSDQKVLIPEPGHKLSKLVDALRVEYVDEGLDAADQAIMDGEGAAFAFALDV
ncbi:hypothetical protein BXZ70DRAFT_1040306 [Cristinia sonorae]|uniref:PARP catalytic domain-containing protein n=1 Tax=Cristinia sonorae TaxID=1940300 RepID=A0A8K0UIE3_9AGAR|nr:hypothetical protein BXZ70DRAFT_1040306 [Cristinia sonorae]